MGRKVIFDEEDGADTGGARPGYGERALVYAGGSLPAGAGDAAAYPPRPRLLDVLMPGLACGISGRSARAEVARARARQDVARARMEAEAAEEALLLQRAFRPLTRQRAALEQALAVERVRAEYDRLRWEREAADGGALETPALEPYVGDPEIERLALRALARFGGMAPGESERAWAEWEAHVRDRFPRNTAEEIVDRARDMRGRSR